VTPRLVGESWVQGLSRFLACLQVEGSGLRWMKRKAWQTKGTMSAEWLV